MTDENNHMIQDLKKPWGLGELQSFARRTFDYAMHEDDFAQEVAKTLFSIGNATAAVLWKLDASKKTVTFSSIKTPQQLAFDGGDGKLHLGLVWKALNEGCCLVKHTNHADIERESPEADNGNEVDADAEVENNSGPENGESELFLAQHHQVFLPLRQPDHCDQVLVLFLDSERFEEVSQEHLNQLGSQIELTFCRHLLAEPEGYDEAEVDEEDEPSDSMTIRREARLGELHENVTQFLDEKKNAFQIVNEVRGYFGFGRVSFCSFRGTSCVTLAISGTAIFDRRSSTITTIEKLARTVAITKQPLFHPECDDQLPSDIKTLFARYYDYADTCSIALIPLTKKPVPKDDPADVAGIIQPDPDKDTTVGVLICEGVDASISQRDIEEPWETISTVITNSAANARSYHNLFLMPLWRRLGQVADIFRGHHRNKAIAVVVAIAVCLLALVFVPADFTVRCNGIVQPQHRFQVFASTDGVVQRILAREGQQVKEGDLLVELTNPKMQAEYESVSGKLEEARAELRMVELRRLKGEFTDEKQSISLTQNSAALRSRVDGLLEQHLLLKERLSRLQIRSPADGTIVTSEVAKRLSHRPVKPGDAMMVVADTSSEWELEIRIPDKLSRHVLDAYDLRRVDSSSIPVTYCLASNPTQEHQGHIRTISSSTSLDAEDGSVVHAYVSLESGTAPGTSPVGVDAIAQVYVGRRSLGYCKFHEFIGWVHRAWFKYL